MPVPYAIENEQEASTAIILACLLHQKRQQVIDAQFRHLAGMVATSGRFRGFKFDALVEKGMQLLATYNAKQVIEYSAGFIPDEARESLFAMVCELMTMDGELSATESEVVGLTALHLNVSIELMRVMLTTFLMRNRWTIY